MVKCLTGFFDKKATFLERYLAPILLLSLRIMIALVFLRSGLTKISNFDSTLLLFEYEYAVPYISPVFAAYSATFFELVCSGLLILGLAVRLSALPLIVMTLVIQFFVFQNPEHFYWLAVLATLFIYGGGTISVDRILRSLFKK